MGREDTNSVNDQRQINQQIVDQWAKTMRELSDHTRGEIMSFCSKALLSEDEPDLLIISMNQNWYPSLSTDKVLIQSISDVIANKYGVRKQIRFINSSLTESESLFKRPLKSISVNQCELCDGNSFREQNKLMSYVNAARELKKNIQIMTSTFEKNNLQVLNLGCKPYSDDDADLTVYVELATITGSSIPNDIHLKINLYDEDDEIYLSGSRHVDSDEFDGYDTISINCYDDGHTLENAVKGRLYVTR